jgi:glutathione S-transferase
VSRNPSSRARPNSSSKVTALLSWLLFVASGLARTVFRPSGPFSICRTRGLGYAANRCSREAERHYQVLNDHLAGHEFIVGNNYKTITIADISTWGWLDQASRLIQGVEDDPLAPYPHHAPMATNISMWAATENSLAVGDQHFHARQMFLVSEEEAAAIRAAFDRGGEFAAAVELRRRFPGISDNEQARRCARTIMEWRPLKLPPRPPAQPRKIAKRRPRRDT